jgi:hypothetical protein
MTTTEMTIGDARKHLAEAGEEILAILQKLETTLGRGTMSISLDRDYTSDELKTLKVNINVCI